MPFNFLLCEIDEVFERAIGKSPRNRNESWVQRSPDILGGFAVDNPTLTRLFSLQQSSTVLCKKQQIYHYFSKI